MGFSNQNDGISLLETGGWDNIAGPEVPSVTDVSILFYDVINTTFLKPKGHFLM